MKTAYINVGRKLLIHLTDCQLHGNLSQYTKRYLQYCASYFSLISFLIGRIYFSYRGIVDMGEFAQFNFGPKFFDMCAIDTLCSEIIIKSYLYILLNNVVSKIIFWGLQRNKYIFFFLLTGSYANLQRQSLRFTTATCVCAG